MALLPVSVGAEHNKCELNYQAWSVKEAQSNKYYTYFSDMKAEDPDAVYSRIKIYFLELFDAYEAAYREHLNYVLYEIKMGNLRKAEQHINDAQDNIIKLTDTRKRSTGEAFLAAFQGRLFFLASQSKCGRSYYKKSLSISKSASTADKELSLSAYLMLMFGLDEQTFGRPQNADTLYLEATRIFLDQSDSVGHAVAHKMLKENNYGEDRITFLNEKINEAKRRGDNFMQATCYLLLDRLTK